MHVGKWGGGGAREDLTILKRDFLKSSIVFPKKWVSCPPPGHPFVGGPDYFIHILMEQNTLAFI